MQKSLLLIFALFTYLISIILGFYSGLYFLSSSISLSVIVLLLVVLLLPVVEICLPKKLRLLQFYPIGIFILAVFLTLLLDYGYLYTLILQFVSIVFALRYMFEYDHEKKFHITYIFYGFIMLVLSSLLRFVSFQLIPHVLIYGISDDINSKGITLFFKGGIVFSGLKYFILTISFQYLILILILGFLLLENVKGIIFIAMKNRKSNANALNLTSTTFSIFSCQCETTTSIVPAIGAEILGIISIPVILESLVLSIGTFVLIHYWKNDKNSEFFKELWTRSGGNSKGIFVAIVLMISIPLIVTYGVYYDLQRNLLFYFLTNIGLFVVSTYVILNLLTAMKIEFTISKVLYFILSVLILILMVIWYIPYVLDSVVFSGILFSIMGIFSVISGLLLALILRPISKINRSIIYEYITGMFPIIFVIILYFTVITSSRIWPIFNITDQLIFGLVLLGITLPFMWFFTNYSIYGNRFFEKQ
jgi:hypothetical protein